MQKRSPEVGDVTESTEKAIQVGLVVSKPLIIIRENKVVLAQGRLLNEYGTEMALWFTNRALESITSLEPGDSIRAFGIRRFLLERIQEYGYQTLVPIGTPQMKVFGFDKL